jgi:hypothetical protein
MMNCGCVDRLFHSNHIIFCMLTVVEIFLLLGIRLPHPIPLQGVSRLLDLMGRWGQELCRPKMDLSLVTGMPKYLLIQSS